MKKMTNQALNQQALFYNPVNKQVEFGENGDVTTMFYYNTPEGVEVFDDHSVKLTFFAPDAKKVEVCGWGGFLTKERIAMESQGDGYFTVTLKQLTPGFYYHEYYVDDNWMLNPLAPIGYGGFTAANFFEVPVDDKDFYLLKQVSHGQIHLHFLDSSVTGRTKCCYVYTPPGYESLEQANTTYPVVYLYHGVGENETGWIWQGKIHNILDNLYAQGLCEPMIIVMTSGYSIKPYEDPTFHPGNYVQALTDDLMPFIENMYRTKNDPHYRCVAGLSLGGAQAASIYHCHPNLFGNLGIFSAAGFLDLSEDTYDFLYMSCGTFEPMWEQLIEHQHKLSAKGENVKINQFTGYHDWQVWKESFRDMVIDLFKQEHRQLAKDMTRPFTYHSEWFQAKEDVYDRYKMPQSYYTGILNYTPEWRKLLFVMDENNNPAGRYQLVPPAISVNEDSSVSFNVHAPNASKVEVQGFEIPRTKLKKNGEYWQASVKNLKPGFYYHDYYIDGQIAINPQAPIGYGCFKPINYLEVPGKENDFYIQLAKKRGTLTLEQYPSTLLDDEVRLCYVYTPFGYEHSNKKYPVLYLQHGGGENEIGWIWHGKINQIIDHLIADHSCEEMIIVMNTGYAFKEDPSSHPLLGLVDRLIAEECVPFIDQKYRTLTDRKYRAMAGLSMGSMQTQKTVMAYPELFASAGLFSGSIALKNDEEDYTPILLDQTAFQKQFDLLFVGIGTNDRFYSQCKANIDTMNAHHIHPETFFIEGGHDWTFWRKCVHHFLPLLFKA